MYWFSCAVAVSLRWRLICKHFIWLKTLVLLLFLIFIIDFGFCDFLNFHKTLTLEAKRWMFTIKYLFIIFWFIIFITIGTKWVAFLYFTSLCLMPSSTMPTIGERLFAITANMSKSITIVTTNYRQVVLKVAGIPSDKQFFLALINNSS